MSSGNRSAKRELEKIYGKGCFFARAKCAEKIETIGGIKTFKTFLRDRKFKGKKISHQITYHHLKHRSERRKNNCGKWCKCRRDCPSIYTQPS